MSVLFPLLLAGGLIGRGRGAPPKPGGNATIGITATSSGVSETDVTAATNGFVTTQFDSVLFKASGWVGWDTPLTHAGSGNIYKPQHHDILYFWDTKRTGGKWSSPQKILPAHNSKQFLQGHGVSVVFEDAGVYVVRLYAYEPSSKKFGFTEITVTVQPLTAAFPGDQVVLVNPSGDKDFSWGSDYIGAQTYNLANVWDEDHASWADNIDTSRTNRCFLFKPNARYAFPDFSGAVNKAHIPEKLFIGCPDASNRPLFDGVNNQSNRGLNIGVSYTNDNTISIFNLEFDGGLDLTSNNEPGIPGGPSGILGTGDNIRLIVHNVRVDGLAGNIWNLQGSVNGKGYWHFDDYTQLTYAGQEYSIITQTMTGNPDSFMGFTGCRINHDLLTPAAEGQSGAYDGQIRASCRHNGTALFYMDACDWYHASKAQPALKLLQFDEDGGSVNMTRSYMESGEGFVILLKGEDNDRFADVVARACTFVVGFSEDVANNFGIESGAKGCSFEGCVFIHPAPANPVAVTTSGTRAGIAFNCGDQAPNRTVNCTGINHKPNNGKYDVAVDRSGGDYTSSMDLEYHVGVDIDDGPIELASGSPFNHHRTGRVAGTRSGEDSTFDTDYAFTPAAVYLGELKAGSPALAAYSGGPCYPLPFDAQTEADLITNLKNINRGAYQGAAIDA